MRTNVTRARAFGRRVAEAQDRALRDDDALPHARTLFLSASVAPERAPRGAAHGRLWVGVAAASALAAAACVLVSVRLTTRPLAFEVGPSEDEAAGGRARSGVVGEVVTASTSGRLPIHFSDGSLVRLEPTARARIVAVDPQGSRLLLEEGVAHASVVHREATRWSVQAGPFEVRVTGTQFDVAWDPPRNLFSVSLIEGSVVVTGCSMSQPRVVSAGETFRARCGPDGAVRIPVGVPVPLPSAITDVTPAASAAPPPSEPTALAPAHARREPTALAPATPPRPSQTSAPSPHPTWRELLALRRYADAIDAADAAGLLSICATADAEALMDLSDAARFAGHIDRAKLVLREVRRRFAGQDRAATAAFQLGRIAFDDESRYAEAAEWFAAYLAERPRGPLARAKRRGGGWRRSSGAAITPPRRRRLRATCRTSLKARTPTWRGASSRSEPPSPRARPPWAAPSSSSRASRSSRLSSSPAAHSRRPTRSSSFGGATQTQSSRASSPSFLPRGTRCAWSLASRRRNGRTATPSCASRPAR